MTRTRVLVVDDSVVIRRLVSQALERDPGIEVVGTAANGRIALAKAALLEPDAVTMDIEMPEMDGIAAVKALRAAGHRMPIVMFSTLTERGAAATMDALAAGASDYVTKPTGAHSVEDSLHRVGEELLPRIHALVPRRAGGSVAEGRSQPAAAPPGAAPRRAERVGPPVPVKAVVVGSSTGGPQALATVLGSLGARLPVPTLVVQHMPPLFTRRLAERLDRLGPSPVVEAAGGEPLEPGGIYLAPGDRHLAVLADAAGVRTRLTDAPPVNYTRPSVDVLFESAVQAFGGAVLAVVLTGMGADGRAGAGRVVAAGGTVIAQDAATSVVWGMPGAVVGAGYAHEVLPLDEIGAAVARLAGEGRG